MEKQLMCTVCLEKLRNGDNVRKTPCRHEFHKKCIDEWIDKSPTCPHCRAHLNAQRDLNNWLVEAIIEYDDAKMKKLISEGAEVNSADDQGWAPIHHAAYYRNQSAADILCQYNANVDANRLLGFEETALHIATFGNDEGMVHVLLHYGSVDVLDRNGDTPLIYAAANNRANIAMLLIRAGALVNWVDKEGWNALETAAFYGYSNVVKMFLSECTDTLSEFSLRSAENLAANKEIKQLLVNYFSKLFMVAVEEGNVSKAQNFLLKGASINFVNREGFTALHTAIEEKGYHRLLYNPKEDMVRALLKFKPNVNLQTKHYKSTPLMIAAEKGNMNILKLLLNNRADKELRNREGKMALDITKCYQCRALLKNYGNNNLLNEQLLAAAKASDVPKVHNLIAKGADINYGGKTALHYATLLEHETMVEALLEHSPLLKSIPLIWAAEKGNANILKLLLDSGANSKLKNLQGKTALDLAKSDKCRSLLEDHNTVVLNQKLLVAATEKNVAEVRNLIEKGADINCFDEWGITALHNAVMFSDKAMVKALLNYKPNTNAQCEITHHTPLMLAAHQGDAIILKLLLDSRVDKTLKNYKGKTALDMTEDFNCKALLEDKVASPNHVQNVNQNRHKITDRNRIYYFIMNASFILFLMIMRYFECAQK